MDARRFSGSNGAFPCRGILFILGIKRMASPLNARSGIQWAGVGMVLATARQFLLHGSTAKACIICLGFWLRSASAPVRRGCPAKKWR